MLIPPRERRESGSADCQDERQERDRRREVRAERSPCDIHKIRRFQNDSAEPKRCDATNEDSRG